jgi:hypothetical protein
MRKDCDRNAESVQEEEEVEEEEVSSKKEKPS